MCTEFDRDACWGPYPGSSVCLELFQRSSPWHRSGRYPASPAYISLARRPHLRHLDQCQWGRIFPREYEHLVEKLEVASNNSGAPPTVKRRTNDVPPRGCVHAKRSFHVREYILRSQRLGIQTSRVFRLADLGSKATIQGHRFGSPLRFASLPLSFSSRASSAVSFLIYN